MPMPPVHHAFLQRVTPAGCEETSILDGRANDPRARRVEAPHVVRRRGALEALRSGAGMLLKNAARLIYLAPVLIIAKLALYLADEPRGDLVIVAFVVLVVVFFALLNIYIFISVLWWIYGRDAATHVLRMPFDQDGRDALPLLPGEDISTEIAMASPPVGQIVRTRGAIVRLGPNREGDGTVLCDLWTKGELDLRLTEAIDFAVVGRGRLPVVVRLTEAPMVVARPASTRLGAHASQASAWTTRLLQQAGIGPETAAVDCALLTLREGDEVEVTGAVLASIDNVDGFELEGTYASVPLRGANVADGGTPFRDKPGGPGAIIGARVSIRHCSGA